MNDTSPTPAAEAVTVKRYEYDSDNEHMLPELFGTVHMVLASDYDAILRDREAANERIARLEAALRPMIEGTNWLTAEHVEKARALLRSDAQGEKA